MEFSQLLCLLLLHTSSPVQRGTSVCFLPYQADIYICEENSTSSAKNLYLIVVIKHYFLSSKHTSDRTNYSKWLIATGKSNARLRGAFELPPLQRCTKTWLWGDCLKLPNYQVPSFDICYSERWDKGNTEPNKKRFLRWRELSALGESLNAKQKNTRVLN